MNGEWIFRNVEDRNANYNRWLSQASEAEVEVAALVRAWLGLMPRHLLSAPPRKSLRLREGL